MPKLPKLPKLKGNRKIFLPQIFAEERSAAERNQNSKSHHGDTETPRQAKPKANQNLHYREHREKRGHRGNLNKRKGLEILSRFGTNLIVSSADQKSLATNPRE